MSTQVGRQFPDETPIERLDVTVHTYNCLKRNNIHRVSQILAMDRGALMKIRNLTIENANELRDKLIAHRSWLYVPREAPGSVCRRRYNSMKAGN